MVEVLKQALDALKDVGVLTDREWQAVHKNKANELRQAIAELESQEPVAWCRYEDGMWVYYETKAWDDLQPLYTHPPQRTWVGLTDEEVRKICVNEWGGYEQCRAIEAKLMEKNT